MTVKRFPRHIQEKIKLRNPVDTRRGNSQFNVYDVIDIFNAFRLPQDVNRFGYAEKDSKGNRIINSHPSMWLQQKTRLMPVYMFDYESKKLERFESSKSVAKTSKDVEETLKDSGIEIFAKIDHASLAKKAGIKLRPTQLIIFGNPKVATPLMQQDQRLGIDLPLRMLIWEDEHGKVWITFRKPEYMFEDYSLMDVETSIKKIEGVLKIFKDNNTIAN